MITPTMPPRTTIMAGSARARMVRLRSDSCRSRLVAADSSSGASRPELSPDWMSDTRSGGGLGRKRKVADRLDPARTCAVIRLVASRQASLPSVGAVICIASAIGTVLQQGQPLVNYVDAFGPYWAEVFGALGLFNIYSSGWFLVILAFLLDRFRTRLRFFPVWQQALAILALLFNDVVVAAVVHLMLGLAAPDPLRWLSPLAGALMWGPLYALLDALRLRRRRG